MIPQFRVGIGYDSHRLVPDRPLILGGVTIPFELGLDGHSDADVLLHAITDAICGASGLPDIGQLFPDTDPQWKGANSGLLLKEAAAKSRAAGWRLVNVDAVLIAQRPKISPHVRGIRENIANLLQLEGDCVNIRGKTAEGLGALGAGLGMAVHAVCLVVRED